MAWNALVQSLCLELLFHFLILPPLKCVVIYMYISFHHTFMIHDVVIYCVTTFTSAVATILTPY